MTTGKRNRRDVWTASVNKDKGAKGCHFATFNAELITPMVLMGCRPGGVILDCYAGSGTVGEVALALGRKALLIELNPVYCSHIEKRLNCTRKGKHNGEQLTLGGKPSAQFFTEQGARGGKTAASHMTQEETSIRGRKATVARWG